MRGDTRALAALLLTLLPPATIAAQETSPLQVAALDPLPLGRVVERVVSRADSTTSWALYVPSAYDPERSWPVLFLMDPRGRALEPLGRLIEAAERYGYVVMSSYDTASDFLWEDPNDRAVGAMLDDAQRLFRMDARRLYLVGFSGTTRAAWSLGMRLQDNVAGVIGSGGGLPPMLYRTGPNPLRQVRGLAFHGFAGSEDFSHDEMVKVRDLLTRYAVPNRLEFFPGPHDWPPAEHLTRAVEWMDVRAMAVGLRPKDGALADSLFQVRIARARTLEAAGRPADAWREYVDVAGLFEDLADVSSVRVRADSLGATDAVVSAVRREQEFEERFFTLVNEFEKVLFQIQIGSRRPDARRMIQDLDLEGIRRTLENASDPEERDAARRLLEHVFVQTSFYQARAFLIQGRPEHALAMLAVAERAFPDRPRVRLLRAQALALSGKDREALTEIRRALSAGYPPAAIRTDADLASLRALPGFDDLVRATGDPGGPR